MPDLPAEDRAPSWMYAGPRGIHVIPLLAPTSTDLRIERACRAASGFIYCVSLTGVTGARQELPPGVFQLLKRVRRYTDLPLAAGFGVSRREHLESIGGHAQAAIVGSALIQVIMASPREELVDNSRRFVRELTAAVPSLEGTSS